MVLPCASHSWAQGLPATGSYSLEPLCGLQEGRGYPRPDEGTAEYEVRGPNAARPWLLQPIRRSRICLDSTTEKRSTLFLGRASRPQGPLLYLPLIWCLPWNRRASSPSWSRRLLGRARGMGSLLHLCYLAAVNAGRQTYYGPFSPNWQDPKRLEMSLPSQTVVADASTGESRRGRKVGTLALNMALLSLPSMVAHITC